MLHHMDLDKQLAYAIHIRLYSSPLYEKNPSGFTRRKEHEAQGEQVMGDDVTGCSAWVACF